MNKQLFMERLTFLLEKLNFNKNVKTEALNYISNNYNHISKMAEDAYKGNWNNYLTNIDDPYIMLMILIYRIVDLDESYREKRIPLSILIDTLSDLTLRQRIHFEQYNKLGLTYEDVSWLKHIYYLNIFKLGSLQYEFADMSYLECLLGVDLKIKKRLPEGSPILKIHIRRDVDLSKQSVDRSLEYSKEFFQTYYPEYKYRAYTCSSWMLYSKNKLILSPLSNILNFSDRFELICETQRSDMAIKYIFQREDDNIKDFPKETSLQRNALENLDSLGVGYGVIYIQEV